MRGKDYIKLPHIKEEIKSRFNYNPETGELTWAYRFEDSSRNIYFNRHFAGKVVGRVEERPNGYKMKVVTLELFGKRVGLVVARVCWLVQTGDWPKHTIDHINRDSLDNRWENLRDVSQSINNWNKSSYRVREGKSFKGITKQKNSYCAFARGKYLGSFKTPEEAARAYDNKALELWGDKAVLNFPVDKE